MPARHSLSDTVRPGRSRPTTTAQAAAGSVVRTPRLRAKPIRRQSTWREAGTRSAGFSRVARWRRLVRLAAPDQSDRVLDLELRNVSTSPLPGRPRRSTGRRRGCRTRPAPRPHRRAGGGPGRVNRPEVGAGLRGTGPGGLIVVDPVAAGRIEGAGLDLDSFADLVVLGSDTGRASLDALTQLDQRQLAAGDPGARRRRFFSSVTFRSSYACDRVSLRTDTSSRISSGASARRRRFST